MRRLPAMKSFPTRRRDRYRPPYGKHLATLPRQCVFAGTINPPDDGRYLRDETGARRLLAGSLSRDDRPQEAWNRRATNAVGRSGACASRRASRGGWRRMELEALATAEQALRLVVDPWTDSIREWVGDRTDVSVKEVLQHVFGIAAGPGAHAARDPRLQDSRRSTGVPGRVARDRRESGKTATGVSPWPQKMVF